MLISRVRESWRGRRWPREQRWPSTWQWRSLLWPAQERDGCRPEDEGLDNSSMLTDDYLMVHTDADDTRLFKCSTNGCLLPGGQEFQSSYEGGVRVPHPLHSAQVKCSVDVNNALDSERWDKNTNTKLVLPPTLFRWPRSFHCHSQLELNRHFLGCNQISDILPIYTTTSYVDTACSTV